MRKGMRETGYIDGQNMRLEYRFGEGDYGRLPALAAHLVSRKVDVIFTNSDTPGALAAKDATATIPIVLSDISDPVGVGLVANLAHPGGNVTGFSDLVMTGKLFEVLSEMVPHAGTIALMTNPDNPNSRLAIQKVRQAASATGIKLAIQTASTAAEIDAAFTSVVEQRAGALVVDSDKALSDLQAQIVALASRQAIPTIYPDRNALAKGGLIHYGPDLDDVARRGGVYVGRILHGERPADLPVQQPTLLKFAINLKTAKALGLVGHNAPGPRR